MKDQNISDTKTSRLAAWSLVLGILGILLFGYLGFVAAIAAVICGHKVLSRLEKDARRSASRRMAIAGMLLGYLAIPWLTIYLVSIWNGFSHH